MVNDALCGWWAWIVGAVELGAGDFALNERNGGNGVNHSLRSSKGDAVLQELQELTTASCEVCDFSEEAVEVRGVVIDCDGMVVLVGDDGQLAGAACV